MVSILMKRGGKPPRTETSEWIWRRSWPSSETIKLRENNCASRLLRQITLFYIKATKVYTK